jgi:hypothetical protein
MKLNNSDNYESITIQLSKEKTPIAWEQKVISNMNSGLSREEAEKEADKTIEVEMYYDADAGLFLVEAEAVESGTIYNPYSGELIDEADEY